MGSKRHIGRMRSTRAVTLVRPAEQKRLCPPWPALVSTVPSTRKPFVARSVHCIYMEIKARVNVAAVNAATVRKAHLHKCENKGANRHRHSGHRPRTPKRGAQDALLLPLHPRRHHHMCQFGHGSVQQARPVPVGVAEIFMAEDTGLVTFAQLACSHGCDWRNCSGGAEGTLRSWPVQSSLETLNAYRAGRAAAIKSSWRP